MSIGFFSVLLRSHRAKAVLLSGVIMALMGVLFVSLARAQEAPVDVKINFQPEALNGTTPVLTGGTPVPVPAGYAKDVGQGYDDARGHGWVRQDSLSNGTHEPLSVVPNARDRNTNTRDQRLDTFVHMQAPTPTPPATTTNVTTPAAWEYALPDGTYLVTVAVGDPNFGADAESHLLNVEGVEAIKNFPKQPSGGTTANGTDLRHRTATVRAEVTDGRLTVDAVGGTNTKINYVDIRELPAGSDFGLKVNFQSDVAPVPAGYVRDFGEAYGARGAGFGAAGSTGLEYGWVSPGTSTPLNLVTNGRDRNVAADVSAGLEQRLDTLMHMQANSISGTFAGIKAEGAWEVAVPNGTYDVAVSAGDPSPGVDPTTHRVNVEGENVVANYPVATNAAGAARFTSGTGSVDVTDGRLTVDATGGGINTKINYIDLTRTGDVTTPTDTTPPDAPTVDLATGSDSGSSSTDDLTNDDTPTFTGDAEAGSTVEVFAAGTSLGTAQADGSGYSFTVPANKALAEETTSITATATDAANNVSGASTPLNVTVDKTDPDVSITAGPTGTIDQSSATFEFTAGDGSSVACELDGNVDNSCVSPKAYTGLDDGDYTFALRSTDAAGNEGSATRDFTVNTPGPNVPSITGPANGSYDTDGDLTISGTAEADSAIELFEGSASRGTATAGASGDWSIELANVADGEHAYTARATKNGKTSEASAAVTVNVDTTAPGAPANLSAEGRRGAIALGWDDSPASENVAGYNVYRSETQDGTYTKLNGSLLTASGYDDTPLPDETTRYYRVMAIDAAGNESEAAAANATTPVAPDETPPGAPTGLAATAGDGRVDLDWTDNGEADLAGYNVYRSTSATVNTSGTPLNASPLGESSYADTAVQNGTTYYYAVKAVDGAGNASAASATQSARPQVEAECARRSTLECAAVKKTGAVALDFSGSEGGLADKDGQDTGFTMVDPPSARLAADNPVFHADVPGYEPGRVDVSGGRLTISSTKGIMYRSNGTATTQTTETNSQINALGVGMDAAGKKVRLETTIMKPTFPTAANSEQGGLWFGLNEDNYAKLVLVNMGNGTAKVQLAREVGAISNGPTGGALVSADEVNTANSTFATGTAVKLVLEATAPTGGQANGTLTGTYKIGDGAEQTLQALALPASFFEGTQISPSGAEKATFAGLSATNRRGSTSINAAFENFSATTGGADATAPTVTNKTPAGGATGVERDANVEATFSEDMDEASVEASGNFVLAEQGGTAVDAAVAYDAAGDKATLNPAADLEADTTYTATIQGGSGGVEDAAGNPLAADETWSFTTEPEVDTTAPATPANLAASPGDGKVDLSWNAVAASDLAGYNVYRDGAASPLNNAPLDATSYADTGLTNGTAYSYTVSAVDESGNESAKSQAAQATPQAAPQGNPLALEFDRAVTDTINDKDNEGTGFTSVQPNTAGDQYQAGKLDLQASNGKLVLTAMAGSNTTRNDLKNALRLAHNGTEPYEVGTRVVGPLTNMTASAHQGGIYIGPDQNNYVKLVANHGGTNGTQVQFYREVNGSSDTTTRAEVGFKSFTSAEWAAINTLDLFLTVDPTTGVVEAEYAVNGGARQSLPTATGTRPSTSTYTVPAASRAAFFNADSKAGILAFTLDAPEIPVTFERFEVKDVEVEPDTTAPAAPQNLRATAGDARVDLAWDANTEADVAGYNVYRGTTSAVDTSGTPLNASPLAQPSYADSSVQNGTTYHYVVQAVDTSGNKSGASARVSATPRVATGGQQFSAKINFQNAAAAVPSGYFRDYGQAYGARTAANQGTGLTYGWIDPSTRQPLDLSVGGTIPGNGRDRAEAGLDQRLNTLMHMQGNNPVNFNGTPREGAWEIAVPNGTYAVTLSVGDATAGSDPMSHEVNVEGVKAINDFVPNYTAGSVARFRSATVEVQVNDGKLTIDAAGGTNTKINYADIASIETGPDTTPPAVPANAQARAGDSRVTVTWDGNAEPDIAGYNVYAGSSAQGTPLNGSTLLGNAYLIDRNLTNGTARTYVIEAVDRSGNKSAVTQPVSATPQANATDDRPKVSAAIPPEGATGVPLRGNISAQLSLVAEGVDESTFSAQTVRIVKVSDGSAVASSYGTSGGNDVINAIPNSKLEPNTRYRFEVTDGVKDLNGIPFVPFTSTFTTGTSDVFTPPGVTKLDLPGVSFSRVAQSTPNKTYTSVTFGPDGKLYAGTTIGEIYRFDVAQDGTLSNATLIDTVRQSNTANNGQGDCNTSTVGNNGCTKNRLIIGMTFEPGSTADNPKLWITHSTFGFGNMKDWGGKLSVLSGQNLNQYRDVLTNLPRSSKDHLTNSVAFKDGKIYIPVGATTAMGAYDQSWKGTERLLSAAVIEVDYQNIQGTLDAKTIDGGGTYDPYAPGAPVKIYATGVRNAVDLVWHSNGHLYAPTNGSAGGSNVPATPSNFQDLDSCERRGYTGPAVPDFDGAAEGTGASRVPTTQLDYLFDVVRGGYYGNPNPSRCEWVLNLGDPTTKRAMSGANVGEAAGEVDEYPDGTLADPNYRGWAYNFINNKSPNGAIEYKGNNFGGRLEGKLIVARYTTDDIIVLDPAANGDIARDNAEVPGFTKVPGSDDPLDLIEDPRNGNIYVTEGVKNPPDGTGKITLLKAADAGTPRPADAKTDKERLVFNDVQNGAASASQTVTVRNAGGENLTITGASLSGTNANQFQVTSGPAGSVTLTPGQTQQIGVAFNPTSAGPKGASLDIATNDPDSPTTKVNLRGLGTLGLGGSNEPSLQWILDTYEIPVNVGDPDKTNNDLPASASAIGEEISGLERMQAAYSDAPVTVEPLAVFGPQHTGGTVTKVGRYVPGSTTQKSELFTVPNSGYQSLNPGAQGSFNFETPDSFGLYSIWPFFNDREVYSEDDLNTWETNAANRHKVRVYPLKKADGTVEQNAYIVATEEHVSGYDYQDVVYIIRNARPAGADTPEIDAPNPNELVFSGVKGSQNLPTQSVTVKNSGKGVLEISGASITGTNASAFQLVNPPSFPLSIPSNETATFSVKFVPGSTQVGSLSAKLGLQTSDADEANVDVGLYGLATNGEQGNNEPTLQDVVNTLGHPVRVHDLSGNPLTYGTDPGLKGEEVRAPLFQKAGSGDVTIEPVARYSPDEVLPFGYYTYPDGNLTENVVATIDLDQEQTLNPKVQAGGGNSFDPGSEKFGVFVDSKSFNRKSYQQDNLNTGSVAHAVRVYPAENRAGETIANTYLVTFEDAANGDYQDYVFRVTNARPAQANTGTGASGKINFQTAQAEVPSGYTRDVGQGFDATRGFGWIDAASKAPVDLTAQTRLRTSPDDQRLKTLILAQGAGGLNAKANNAWEYTLPNGTYEVTLSVGDGDFTDSVHRVNVEGVNAINNFAPTAATEFANNTLTVPVTDGRLTLDFGGSTASYNTKLNYVDIQSVSGTTPETATGNAQPGNVITTDTENGGNGATPADPVETTVTVPTSVTSGTISINEKAITQTVPSGYLFFGQQVEITGPAATTQSPYPVVFEIDPSTLPTGANETNIQAFKDGALVQNCATDAGEGASPNPCVLSREKASNGDILVTVRTSSFSSWNFGVSGNNAQDTTLPKVDVAVGGTKLASGAYKGKAVVTIDASDAGGSGLDETFYSLDGGAFKAYTAQFDEARDVYTYKLDVTGEGNHNIRARAIDGAGNTTTTAAQSFSVAASKAEIELENGDGGAISSTVTAPGVPFPDRLAMSRIQNPQDGTGTVPKNYFHEVSTLRVKNTGTDPLDVSNATVSGPFALENPPAFPATVPAGGSLDIKVRFTATGGTVHNGTLTVTSDDADEPTLPVELSGFWQSISEGNQEPDNVEINRVFGYGTAILYPGQQLNNRGKLTAIGDEIISPYWQRASTTKPVSVRQLAAYHTQGNTASFFWHAKGSNTTTNVLTHLGVDGQTLLPRRNGTNPDTGTTPAYAEFTPNATTFGFKIDPEWSDWTKNNSQVDTDNGCTGTCGHHMRFWPVRDRAGKIVPNQYLVGMDYAGINYDFNDNVYLVTNIKPENPAANPATPAPLPGSPSLNLGFDKDYPNTLEDKDGAATGYQANTGTGFSSTQRNEVDQTDGSDSYKPDLLDIDTTAGTLAVRTFGTADTGSNGNQDNTLVNGLQTNFDGSSGRFVVGTKINGPLNLTAGSQQGGVMFGPDQDNFAKLVAINTNGAPAVEFFAEQNAAGATQGSRVAIPNPASVTSLELFLIGDPQDGTVKAAYRLNGGTLETLPNTVTLTGAQIGRFFSEQGKAGIITQHKGGTETTVNFDNFSITEQIPGATPEPQREALYRLDVAGSGNYTDAGGNVWRPDTGFFAPATAPNEGASVQPQDIANTDEDAIYRTYRGNVGNVPQDQRTITYNLPTRGAEQLDLRLHFAERASANNTAGKRLFDIEAEGKLLRDDFDIFAAAGGQNTAIALPLNNVAVRDGNLTLALKASVDYPAIAGIEVLCEGACPAADLTPPAAPAGLAATASTGAIALDWANNSETDLAGYNVYRATSAAGTYAKVNDALITASQYNDAQAPAGAPSYYQVKAVDTSGNESDASATANATRPAANIRINTGGAAQTVNGTTWSACTAVNACSGYVTGGNAYSEAGDTNTGIPANMNNAIFTSEWTGGINSGTPAGQTAFTFNVPVQNGAFNVRLHFAELNKTAANLRLFDVNIEGGAKELTNFDVYAAAGGINKAIVREFTTTVTDGNVTIQFGAVKENAKISAIEILPVPPDAEAPAAPTGLTATASDGIALDWANNAESDLAGYNVYRSTTEDGTYTKLNGAPLQASEYKDADASGPGTSYYQVKAIDRSANESQAASASRELPAPTGFTQITWNRGQGDNSPAPQPVSNSEGQAEVVGGKLYSFGGFDSQKACCTPTKRAYVYDPATNNWTAIADLPFTPTGANFGGVTHTGSANDGTNIFMAGGYTSNAAGNGQTFGSKLVYRYNVANNNYTRLPDLPVERAAGQLEYLNGKLHYFGGTNLARTADVGDHYVLDVANNASSWTTADSMPNPRHHLAAVALDGKIYALGGQHGHDGALVPQSDVHVYDPQANRWTDAKDLPKAINHAGASTFVMDGRIVVVGGQLNNGVSVADASAYDPRANTWTALTPLPVSRHSAVAGAINGSIYFSTGGTAETIKGTTELSGPAAPSITGPADNSFDADGDLTVSGTAPANSAVELFEGPGSVGTATAGNDGSWSIQLTGVAEGSHTYTAKATVSGKTSGASNARTVVVDRAAPTVTARTPQANASDVAAGANVTATFSEEMDAATITGANVKLAEQGGTDVAAAVTYDAASRTATLNPNADLKASTTYTATVGTGVKDRAGNALANAESWTFTVKAPEPQAPIRINTGGPTVTTGGVTWEADRNFSGGKTYSNPQVTAIAGTTDDALYLNERSSTADLGTFSYAIPVTESGAYTVKLHFAEIYHGATGGGAGGSGKRVFSANLEGGATELQNLDLNAVASPMTAVTRSYDVTVNDGTLNAAFSASTNQPTVSAIEVTKVQPDTTKPTVTGITPAADATNVAFNTNATATFSEEMRASTLSASTFKLAEQGGTDVAAAVTYDAASRTATLNPNADLKASTTYTATVTTGAQDAAGNGLAEARTWSFTTRQPDDTTPPAAPSITGPANNSYDTDGNVTVSGTAEANSTVELFEGATEVGQATAGSGGNWSIQLTNVAEGSHTYAATATDAANNASARSGGVTVTVDKTAPTVANVEPVAQSTDVAVGTVVKATFSEDMKASTIDGTTFRLVRASDNAAVAASVTYDAASKTATLDPNANLNPNTTYTATVTTGVQDVAGSAMANVRVWSFTTAQPADTTPPTVSEVSPTAQAADVAPATDVTATFSEAMLANTIDASSFTLTRAADGAKVQANVTYDAASRKATLDPSADLDAGKTYTAQISTTVKDAAGNALANVRVWSFTTRAAMTTQNPIRIEAGGTGRSVNGVQWRACTATSNCSGYVTGGFRYAPATLPNVAKPVSPASNQVYQQEWTGGQTGANPVPVGQTAFSFNVPVQNGGYLVRLHFAEIAQNGAGKRLFDVNIEGGNKELTGFDIFKEAGGMNRAIVREFDAQVTDGTMNIQFIRQVENAKISAIEILPASGGTPAADKAAPAAPNALNATASQSGVALDWADNPEPDVAGYEVHRGDAAGGPFARLNGATLAVGSQYNDATAQMGRTYYYRVVAVDQAGNKSAEASASAAMPQRQATRVNVGGGAVTGNGLTWSGCSSTTACPISILGGGKRTFYTGATTSPNYPAALFETGWSGGQSTGKSAGQRAFGLDAYVPQGSYIVRLHFAEKQKTAAGQRTFHINVEERRVLSNFDVFAAAGGRNRATFRQFTVDSIGTNGRVDIDFITAKDDALVQAVEIIPQ